jgi:hypothetical protein
MRTHANSHGSPPDWNPNNNRNCAPMKAPIKAPIKACVITQWFCRSIYCSPPLQRRGLSPQSAKNPRL